MSAKGYSAARIAPGPKGLPVLGSSLEMMRNPLRFVDRIRWQGDVVRFRAATPSGTLIAHLLTRPEHAEYVLKDNIDNYRKSGVYDRAALFVGNGLLTSSGEHWRRQRRIMQPAFGRRRIAGLASKITSATERMLERWAEPAEREAALDVAREMMRLTLTIVGETLLSTDFSAETDKVGRAASYLLWYTGRRTTAVFSLPDSWPTPRNRRFRRELDVLEELVYGLINDRRSSGDHGEDLLAMLMDARDDETGEAMSDRQLRDEVMTILIAGHETTANALAWTWFLLARHPEAAYRLRAELDGALGGRTPTFADLSSLPYTKMVFQEALRLYPPVWMMARIANETDEIGGYRIPQGSRIALSPYVVHRNPDLWERPEEFYPERFDPALVGDRPRYAYIPFSGGPRNCIGQHFATMEAQLVIATIAQRYFVDLAPGQQVEPDPGITLRPRNGLPMLLREART